MQALVIFTKNNLAIVQFKSVTTNKIVERTVFNNSNKKQGNIVCLNIIMNNNKPFVFI